MKRTSEPMMYSKMQDSKKGQVAKMRPEYRKEITKRTKTAPYSYAVSSVEGNMFLDFMNKDLQKMFGTRMNREEWNYASERLWKVQKYTNWSGD